MPLAWHRLRMEEKADIILGFVEGLTDQDKEDILDEWSEWVFEDGGYGEKQALSTLQQIALKKLLQKTDAWDRKVEAMKG